MCHLLLLPVYFVEKRLLAFLFKDRGDLRKVFSTPLAPAPLLAPASYTSRPQ
jgi:hypothetical protein